MDCIAADPTLTSLGNPPLLYSGDSMGVIKAWSLDIIVRPDGIRSIRGTVVEEHSGHRTGVCTMLVTNGQVWSGEFFLPNSNGTELPVFCRF